MIAAVLDTCVLWPSLQRDVLLSLAIQGLYRPLWSSSILAELEEHEARKLVRRGASGADAETAAKHLITQMERAFDDSCVQGWEPLEGNFSLPDPDDEHVVAAAVVGGAEAIVTANLPDFPAGRVPARIRVQPPNEFVLQTVKIDSYRGFCAVQELALRYQRPQRSVHELLLLMEARYDMGAATEIIRREADQA
ncbi:PIN domain-containing protein [Ruania zhangjianzhongii]|uniref:PIN domain-containing protein n=1 Tax=Ruania zhangjianzhongii TaxID=2603206 RepID=UPI0011C999D9|nr:PIN domain-containing protein [Ruania zhangjianzhongii]